MLAKAAVGRTRLSVLDWGGGVGQHYLLSRGALPELELSYHCRDLPLVCELGRELNPDVTFYDDDGCFQRRYDLVVASNSLQYNEDWRDGLRKLGRAAIDCLYVAQLPTVLDTGSFVAVQRPYGYGFDTEYLGWIFNRDEFLSAVDSLGLEVTREFFFGNSVDVHGVGEPAVHRGFLMRPRG